MRSCAQRVGKPDDAKRYMDIARRYAAKWQEMAKDDGRTRLAYHLPGSWGMKHNLIWDRVLGLNLFPDGRGRRRSGLVSEGAEEVWPAG